jgi:hypothetical protein
VGPPDHIDARRKKRPFGARIARGIFGLVLLGLLAAGALYTLATLPESPVALPFELPGADRLAEVVPWGGSSTEPAPGASGPEAKPAAGPADPASAEGLGTGVEAAGSPVEGEGAAAVGEMGGGDLPPGAQVGDGSPGTAPAGTARSVEAGQNLPGASSSAAARPGAALPGAGGPILHQPVGAGPGTAPATRQVEVVIEDQARPGGPDASAGSADPAGSEAAGPTMGSVSFLASEPAAQILVNHQVIGSTPLPAYQLPVGEYRIVLRSMELEKEVGYQISVLAQGTAVVPGYNFYEGRWK